MNTLNASLVKKLAHLNLARRSSSVASILDFFSSDCGFSTSTRPSPVSTGVPSKQEEHIVLGPSPSKHYSPLQHPLSLLHPSPKGFALLQHLEPYTPSSSVHNLHDHQDHSSHHLALLLSLHLHFVSIMENPSKSELGIQGM